MTAFQKKQRYEDINGFYEEMELDYSLPQSSEPKRTKLQSIYEQNPNKDIVLEQCDIKIQEETLQYYKTIQQTEINLQQSIQPAQFNARPPTVTFPPKVVMHSKPTPKSKKNKCQYRQDSQNK